jgi:hypothetical protein
MKLPGHRPARRRRRAGPAPAGQRPCPAEPIGGRLPDIPDGQGRMFEVDIDPSTRQRRDYASLADFADPDGNTWVLQEIGFRAQQQHSHLVI